MSTLHERRSSVLWEIRSGTEQLLLHVEKEPQLQKKNTDKASTGPTHTHTHTHTRAHTHTHIYTHTYTHTHIHTHTHANTHTLTLSLTHKPHTHTHTRPFLAPRGANMTDRHFVFF